MSWTRVCRANRITIYERPQPSEPLAENEATSDFKKARERGPHLLNFLKPFVGREDGGVEHTARVLKPPQPDTLLLTHAVKHKGMIEK